MRPLLSFDPFFYTSLAVLVLGVAGSMYLFAEWLRHGRRHAFLLFWAAGLALLDWFLIPTVLAGTGEHMVLTDFNPLFSVSFPLTFLGLVLVYVGIRSLMRASLRRATYVSLFIWFLVSLVYFAFLFRDAQTIHSRASTLAAIALFFLPVQVMNLSAFWKAYNRKELFAAAMSKLGIALMIISMVVGVAGSFFAVHDILVYPPAFAVVVLFSPSWLIAEAGGVALLVAGFALIQREAVSRDAPPEIQAICNEAEP
jgi:hypothetical protein